MAKCFICGSKISLFDEKIQTLDSNYICKECLMQAGIPIGIPTRIESMRSSKVREYLEKRNGIRDIFTPTDAVEHFIEVDETHQLIKTIQYGSGSGNIVAIDEIVGFDIVEDGMTVTKGGLSSAVAGGLLFGKTGAIAGAALGRKKTRDVCSSLDVIIILKNSYFENLTIRVISGETSHHNAKYVAAQQMAKKCIKLLERITGAPNENGEELNAETSEKKYSTVDEILRFKQLLDDGIITQEEFDFQKRKLLGMPD